MDSASAKAALDSFQAPSSTDVLTAAQQKYGVTDLQKRVGDLRSLTGNLTSAIAAVDPSVTGRTAGSLTTEGQRSALVSRERAPIVGQLGTANESLTTAGSDLTTATGNADKEANATIEDNKQKYQRLVDTYNIANAREEAQRQTAAEAQKFAYQQQQDAIANSLASQKASSGGAPNAAATKAANVAAITQQLAKNSGSDGFVSRATFGAALNDWQANGGTTRTFWQQYGRYVNPKTKSQYPGFDQR